MKKQAVALAYKPNQDQAPKLVAKGEGHVAEEIIKIANREGILTLQDSLLCASLRNLPVEKEIPRELYDAVAVIFRILVSAPQKKNN